MSGKNKFNKGEVVADYQNYLHQIVSIPDDYHEQMLCNNLQTGERSLLWQYDPRKVSKYMLFRRRNSVMYYKRAGSLGVRTSIELITPKHYFVRTDWSCSPEMVPSSSVYSHIRPIHVTVDELIEKGFVWEGFWTDGYVNLYVTDDGLAVQLVHDRLRFLRTGEDRHLNIIRTVHELENVYQQNMIMKV